MKKPYTSPKKQKEEELRRFNRTMPLLISMSWSFVCVFLVAVVYTVMRVIIAAATGSMSDFVADLLPSAVYFAVIWVICTVFMYLALLTRDSNTKKNKKQQKKKR